MPFNIIRNDIVNMEVDAIVNAANSGLKQGGGVCGRIFSAAGEQEMTKACDAIGWCAPGSAVITPGFKLPARYVIHTVGPVWEGGNKGEEKILRSAYRSSLELALEHKLESVAFPLISSGIYGYPYEEALAIALDEINRFLFQHDMQVTLVMYVQTAYALGFKLRSDIESYIDDNYVDEHLDRRRREYNKPRPSSVQISLDYIREHREFSQGLAQPADEIKGFKFPKEKTFSEALLNLIDAKGMTDVETYKRSNIDRSGSMGGLESDTIGGFNATISDQKKIDGETRVTTILFDNFFEVLHDRINLQDITPLTDKDYFVRGSTALYDAVALGIRKIANVQKQTMPEGRADKVIMVITTDGYENASRETNAAMLHKMIDDCKKEGWEFLFLGADIDAQAAAGAIGIDSHRTSNYIKDKQGVRVQYDSLNNAISAMRSGAPLPENWKDKLDEDNKRAK